MSTKEIILDWLKEKANRDRLPIKNVSQAKYEAFKQYGHVYHFNEGEKEIIGNLGENYFKLVVE